MLSRMALLLVAALMAYASFFFYPKWKHKGTEATISWDVSGYYWYLPSVFIYKDLKHQSFKDSILKTYLPTNTDFQQALLLSNGNYVMKYASGMAFMYLPFFAMAHILAKPLGYRRDGFSEPYQFAIQCGGLLVSLIGLWYLRKLLLLFYADGVVATVIFLLVAGTNYIDYAAINCGMSHCWLFTVYVFIVLNTIYFHWSFKIKYAIRLGLLIGLASLTRPTDAISCTIPLLWGIERISLSAIQQRINLIASKIKLPAVSIISACAVVSIQLCYWKYVSGHWFVYSYGNGQGFSWLHPHIYCYAFNFRSGWLIYSPMMVLSCLGIIPFAKYGSNRIAIIFFLAINYYIVSAWDVWWYGGRAMIQSYPILLFPMASLIAFVRDKKLWLYPFIIAVSAFLYFNIWITIQYHGGGLYDTESMNRQYLLRVAGRWGAPANTVFLRDNTEIYEHIPHDPRLLYKTPANIDNSTVLYTLSKANQLSPVFSFPYYSGSNWIRAEATFHCVSKEYAEYKMAQFVVRLIKVNADGSTSTVKENMIRPGRMLNEGQTKTIALDMHLPSKKFDSVRILFWNANSDKEMQVQALRVWQFNK